MIISINNIIHPQELIDIQQCVLGFTFFKKVNKIKYHVSVYLKLI